MATIRPADLPAAASVNPVSALIVDDGSVVEKATPLQIVDSAIPLASQAEAEAGTDNVKRVTPLRVAQAITALAGSLLLFLAAGVGAIARSFLARLQDTIHLADYGTDAAAWQAALDAAAGKTLLVQPGSYAFTSETLAVSAGTTVIADGATLTWSSQVTAITLGAGARWSGGAVVGPASGVYDEDGFGLYCAGTNNAPAAPTYIAGPMVENCTISNFGFSGVFCKYVDGGWVHHCTITGIGYAAVSMASCNDFKADDNNISTIGPGSAAGNAYGVYIARENGASETEEPRSYRCSVSDNTIKDVIATGGAASNGQGVDTHAGVDCTLHGNTIDGCQVGMAVTASAISNVAKLGPERVSVCGNTITSDEEGYGVLVSGAIVSSTVTITIASPGVVTWTAHGLANGATVVLSTTGALPTGLTAGTTYYVVNSATDTFELAATSGGASINTSGTQSGVHTAVAVNGYAEQIVLSGNVIHGHGVANQPNSGGIFAQGTKGLAINGNTLRNNRCIGINLGIENRGVNVSANTITDPYDDVYTVPNCIHVGGNSVTGYIGGNTLRLENPALATFVAVAGVRIGSLLVGLSLDLGRHAFVGIDATHLAYTELTSTGVNASGLYEARGTSALSGGSKVETFARRFPSSPKVFVQNTGAANPMRVSAASATQFTVLGSGTDTFNWWATT